MSLPRRRLVSTAALASALLLAPACNKTPEPAAEDKKEAPAAPSPATPGEDKPAAPAPAPAPVPTQPVTSTDSDPVTDIGEVVATMQIPTGTAMSDLAAVADMIKPKLSMLITMQAPDMLEKIVGVKLGGADLSAPMSAIIVDPSKHQEPFALLVTVKDGATLSAAAEKAGRGYVERDGLALIGPKDVVPVTSDYAFANLSKAPDHSELVLYPGPLLVAAGPMLAEGVAEATRELEKTGGGAMLGLLDLYRTGGEQLIGQSERIVVSVSPGQSGADLNVHLYPKADSLLAAFIGAQTPSKHDLLTKLPQASAQSIIISGEFHSGPAHQALIDFMAEASAKMYETDLDGQAWASLMTKWLDTLDGRFATVIDASGILAGKPQMKINALMGASDAEQMRVVWRELMAAFVKVAGKSSNAQMMGVGVTASFKADSGSHEGVAIDLYETTLDLSSLPPEQRAVFEGAGTTSQGMEFATFDQYGAMASTEAGGQVATLIDAARGKGPTFTPSGALAATLTEAGERGESLVYYMDIGAMAPPNAGPIPFTAFSASLGRVDQAMSLRVSLRK